MDLGHISCLEGLDKPFLQLDHRIYLCLQLDLTIFIGAAIKKINVVLLLQIIFFLEIGYPIFQFREIPGQGNLETEFILLELCE
jgi:hypothetical protein